MKEDVFNDKRPIFSELKELSNFKNFKVEYSTVVWSDKLDLASEYLFYLSFKHDPDLQKQFKEWGYIKSAETTSVPFVIQYKLGRSLLQTIRSSEEQKFYELEAIENRMTENRPLTPPEKFWSLIFDNAFIY